MSAVGRWARRHGMGVGWEMRELVAELARGKVRRVLEIGTFRGDSLRVWRAAFDPELLIGIQDTNETTSETALELEVALVRGRSQDPQVHAEVVAILAGSPLDFLYVDGDHRYDAVRQDWELYAPLVRPGGLVALHDAVITDNETVEVYRLWQELGHGRRTKLLWDGHNTGTGVAFQPGGPSSMKHGELIARHNPSQSHWELEQLLVELEQIEVARVLEIGVHRGGSARVWRDVLKPELLIGINERDEIEGERDRMTLIFGRSQAVSVHERVVERLAGQGIDFLFVDGGHLYEEVREDWGLYAPLVRAGGVVAFHDARLTGNASCQVHLLWDELRRGRRTKLLWDGTEAGTGAGVIFT